MIFVILGFPGALTDLARDLSLRALETKPQQPFSVELLPPTAIANADLRELSQASQLGEFCLGVADGSIIAISRAPDRDLIGAIRRSNGRHIFVLDDPRLVALALVAAGQDPISAIRTVFASAATILDMLAASGGITFRRSDFVSDRASLPAALVSMLNLSEGQTEQIAVWFEEMATSKIQVDIQDEARVNSLIDQMLHPTLALCLKAAFTGLAGAVISKRYGRIVLTRDLFYTDEKTDQIVPASLDITGRDRCLLFGPFIYLQPGKWMLRVNLAFSAEASGASFMLEIMSAKGTWSRELGRVEFQAITGRYTAQITIFHERADATIEFRLHLCKPAFDGKMSLGYSEIERAPDDDSVSGMLGWQASDLISSLSAIQVEQC